MTATFSTLVPICRTNGSHREDVLLHGEVMNDVVVASTQSSVTTANLSKSSATLRQTTVLSIPHDDNHAPLDALHECAYMRPPCPPRCADANAQETSARVSLATGSRGMPICSSRLTGDKGTDVQVTYFSQILGLHRQMFRLVVVLGRWNLSGTLRDVRTTDPLSRIFSLVSRLALAKFRTLDILESSCSIAHCRRPVVGSSFVSWVRVVAKEVGAGAWSTVGFSRCPGMSSASLHDGHDWDVSQARI